MLKKIILFLFVFIILFTSFPYVYAGEYDIMPLASMYDDGMCYRDVELIGFDDASTEHYIKYRVFTASGLHEGVVPIPDEWYRYDNWFVRITNKGRVSFTIPITFSSSTLTYKMWVENEQLKGKIYNGNTGMSLYRSYYNFDTGTWPAFGGKVTSDAVSIYSSGSGYGDLNPDNFLYCKNMNVAYTINGKDYSRDLFCDYQSFNCPTLSYMPSPSGFRLYMNDFHGSTFSNSFYEVINNLMSVTLVVYDINQKQYSTDSLDLLHLYDLQQDSSGRYYLDIIIGDILPYMQVGNGDYLIAIGSVLTSSRYAYYIEGITENPFSFVKAYTTIDYWRYQYFAGSGTGILVPTDSEGNPTKPSTPVDPDDPSGDTENPNSGVEQGLSDVKDSIDQQTGAIKEQTDAINEQTNTIKEQTEVNKNIFQQIIELPR